MKKAPRLSSKVDVWAIGVNHFLMIAGYQRVEKFSRSMDYIRFYVGMYFDETLCGFFDFCKQIRLFRNVDFFIFLWGHIGSDF